MTLGACPREHELKNILNRGQWPHACPPEMQAHLAACKPCGDLVLVVQAFRSERAHASASARLESPGVLWWRAQLRRRNAAIQRLQRPLLGAQIFSVALTLVAATVFLVWQSTHGLDWFAWLASMPRSLHFEALLPTALQNPIGATALILGLLAAVAALSGALAYTSSEKR